MLENNPRFSRLPFEADPAETQPLHRVEGWSPRNFFGLVSVIERRSRAPGLVHAVLAWPTQVVAVGFGGSGADLGRVGLASGVEGGITRAAAPLLA